MQQSSSYLGIMVSEQTASEPPFAEANFYRSLILTGRKFGLHCYVFNPDQVNWEADTVSGYTLSSKGGWQMQTFPLPDAICDRCFFAGQERSARYRMLIGRLKQVKHIPFLGNSLKNKWEVINTLGTNRQFAPYLPKTVKYSGKQSLKLWLLDNNAAFLKPQDGMQGRGTLHVALLPDGGTIINGRNHGNGVIPRQSGTLPSALHAIDRFTAGRPYLIQQYLELKTPGGEPFDIRSLVQKNGSGKWQHTGMAVRVGSKASVTSNLHGGGRALPAIPFLEQLPAVKSAGSTAAAIHSPSIAIAEKLEQHYGRLVELGIDYGLDRQGKLWLLEVNSKPGRSVFARIRDRKTSFSARRAPLEYARFLINARRRTLPAAQ